MSTLNLPIAPGNVAGITLPCNISLLSSWATNYVAGRIVKPLLPVTSLETRLVRQLPMQHIATLVTVN